MTHSAPAANGWKVALAASVAALTLSGSVFAQNKPAPAASSAAASEAGAEDRLMGALATREMDSLLNYYFEKHKVPSEKQAAVRSIAAWRELANPNTPPARRRALIADGVKGVDNFLAVAKDTEQLMNRAALIVEYGMKGQINQIEYFGESAARQTELNEAAEAVMKILDKTVEECEAQQNQALAGQVRPNAALMQKWQTLDAGCRRRSGRRRSARTGWRCRWTRRTRVGRRRRRRR
jgi:hypothetical protein